jgi:ribonuclease P protein component
MFDKKNKLTKKNEFENVYKRGRTLLCEDIKIFWVKNKLNFFRLGIVVGGKFSKKATERNKIKRRIRSIFQKKEMFLNENIDRVDIVLIPKKKEKQTFWDLQKNIEKAFKKAKIIS